MISNKEITENIYRLVIKRDTIGDHSQYITNLARDCRIISLSKKPSLYDEEIVPGNIIKAIEDDLEINWETEMMLIIICADPVSEAELTIPEAQEPKIIEGTFAWRKPVMSPIPEPLPITTSLFKQLRYEVMRKIRVLKSMFRKRLL